MEINLAINLLFLLIGGGVVYLVIRLHDGQVARRKETDLRAAETARALQERDALADSVADLKRQVAELQTPLAASKLRLAHRREIEDMVALQELVAKDALDVLGRMSPDRIKAVFREVAPHLFFASGGDELPGPGAPKATK